MRPRIWSVDLRHYLGDDGDCAEMPDAMFSVASYMFAIVEWVTMAGVSDAAALTNVACRRRLARRQCRGPILARIDESQSIAWVCGSCGESGFISHWQGTLWDRRDDAELPSFDPPTH